LIEATRQGLINQSWGGHFAAKYFGIFAVVSELTVAIASDVLPNADLSRPVSAITLAAAGAFACEGMAQFADLGLEQRQF
jgi:hypothetical protein